MLLVSAGVGLAVLGEFHFHLAGFAVLLTSAALGGLRGVLLQKILQGREPGLRGRRPGREGAPHPIQLIYAVAPWAALTAAALALGVEGGPILRNMGDQQLPHVRSLMLRLVGMGTLIFAMVIMEFALLARTSALTLSIAATLKEVVTLAVAEEYFHDRLSPTNLLGLFLCVLGAHLYTYLKLRRPAMPENAAYGEKAYLWR